MKKIIYVLFLCLLVGCTTSIDNEVKDEQEKLVSSDIYKHPSSPTLLTSEEFYPLRLKAIQDGELEKVVFVRHVDESNVGKEVTVTDNDELMKLSEFFKCISLTGETRQYGPLGKVADFEVTIKGKTPIYLRISDEALISDGNCLLLQSEKKLYDTLDGIEGDTREVYAPNLDVAFVNNENWTDVKIVEPPFDKDEDKVVEATWRTYNDSLKNVLRLASFIDEEFDNWQDIENQKQLVAGLIQQTPVRYYCSFETPENACVFGEEEILYFPNGKPEVGFVYDLVPSKSVEQTGKQIFEESYRLPELEEGNFASQNYQSYDWLADKSLFVYHLPYEVFFPELESMHILNEETVEDEIRVVLLKYRNEYRTSENPGPPSSILIGLDGYEIALEDHEEDIGNILESNQEYFEQWEYVLRKTDMGYQIVSGKRYNDIHFIAEVDPTKDVIYRDQDNDPQVNLASKDAYHFNRWVKNQKVPTKYKENIHEGLLTIWIKGNNDFAVVFDVETGKTLSQEKIVERLNIDKVKLMDSLKKVAGFENVVEEYVFERANPVDYFMTTNLFIDSKGNPALSIYEDVILFDWEEVR